MRTRPSRFFGRLSPSATLQNRPGARSGTIPGAPSEEAEGRPGRAHPTPLQRGASAGALCLHRGCGARAATTRQHLPGPDARGPRAHTPVRRRHSAAPGPRCPGPLSGARWAAAVPGGGRGHRRRWHLPGSNSFSANGSNRAGSPWHHLPPPSRPRRRLPTAHPAPPTDTIAGVLVPAAAPNSGREEGVRALKERGQAPRLWVGGRRTGGRGRQSRGAVATGGP